jgi:hypothetical protein
MRCGCRPIARGRIAVAGSPTTASMYLFEQLIPIAGPEPYLGLDLAIERA